MKKLILLIFILIISSVPVQAQNTEEIYEPFEEAITSEGISYELDGSILLPSSYNLRSMGMTTSVKDQGDTPYCQTYARIAALESALIKEGFENTYVDLSEMHMLYERWIISGSKKSFGQWCEYSGVDTHGMENSFDVKFYLRNFPVYESQMPMAAVTDDYVPNTTYIGSSPYEIRQIYTYWPTQQSRSEIITATKEAIYKYGGVAGSLSYVPGNDKDKNYKFFGSGKDYTYYLPESSGSSVGHAFEIVGWDDAYPKGNFATAPPDNGAFLCKNSWGSFGGSSGYFWLSYYTAGRISWDAFVITKKGKTPRSMEAVPSEITLYAGQTSNPVSVKLTPKTADPIDWYIDIRDNDTSLKLNADNSITCKKAEAESTRTVTLKSRDKELGLSAKLTIHLKPNNITAPSLIKIPDNGRTDLTEGFSTFPVAGRKSDITYQRGCGVNVEENRYAVPLSYGKGQVSARVDGQSKMADCLIYCTGFDLGEDTEYTGCFNAFLSPVFSLDQGTEQLKEKITYTSSDENIARVDGSCLYFQKNGTVTVSGSLYDEKLTNGQELWDSIKVTVNGLDDGSEQIIETGPDITDPVPENTEPYTDPYAYSQEPENNQIQPDNALQSVVENSKPYKPSKKTEKTPARTVIRSVKSKSGGKAVIKWHRASGANRYEIQVSADKGFKDAVSFYTKKAKYTVKGLESDAKYYIRIRALGKNKSGKWSKKKSVWVKS